MSLNHKHIEYVTANKAKKKNIYIFLNMCKLNAPVIVNAPIHILVNIGQGEGDTKWKGWPTDLYIFLDCKFMIIKVYKFHTIFKVLFNFIYTIRLLFTFFFIYSNITLIIFFYFYVY